MITATASKLVSAAQALRAQVHSLTFLPPVTHIYNPLQYAWKAHRQYLVRYGAGPKRVLFLGMNPGPFGMAQTGVPFGEVAAVRDWMGICAPVESPSGAHPKRPVLGFSCTRSEVSGRRLWGLFARRFGPADQFFQTHFVINYCPLVFVEASGCNRTPDKLPPDERAPLLAACDAHLQRVVQILSPEWIIGIGRFAEARARALFAPGSVKLGTILHPSPASPNSNRAWDSLATRQLEAIGVWSQQTSRPNA